MKQKTLHSGFTLIELLVVMVIIGLLIALVGPNVIGQGEKAKPRAARVQVENFGMALDMFKLEVGRYPAEDEGLEALNTRPPGLEKWDGPYLKKVVPKDPWDHAYVYHHSGNNYGIVSYGADGQSGGTGLDADINSSGIGS